MASVKKWQVLSQALSVKHKALNINEIIDTLLQNRGLTTKKEIEEYLHPDLSLVTPDFVGIDKKQLGSAIKRIQQAIEKKEKIVVFGDYDVDGITATAILWETLYGLGADVTPYIPHRIDEGYGLSIKGVENVILNLREGPHSINRDSSARPQNDIVGLIITVDNGIVANEAVDFAKEQGIDVIVTDHHTIGETLPNACAIVHTTKLCGAGVAYLLSQEVQSVIARSKTTKQSSIDKRLPHSHSFARNDNMIPSDHLALVALATVADLVPLKEANRTLLLHGLKQLRETKRPGLLALCKEAGILPDAIDVYTIGHMIGPRLNAMGRMESAMDSLRLLCTKDRLKAMVLAEKLGTTNKERQNITQGLSEHAKSSIINSQSSMRKLLFIANDAYEEGVIGLVAGKLVEEFYKPAIVLSIGEKVSKASARSVAGFNIIEFIRKASDLLINAGGHPMAAGFTVETSKITLLQELLEKLAEDQVDGEMLRRLLKIDCELPLELVTEELYEALQQLAPFGMSNPEPTFVSDVVVKDIRAIGKENKHLKLLVIPAKAGIQKSPNPTGSRIGSGMTYDAIAFGMGEMASKIKAGDTISIAYTISENVWNNKRSLQLKIKDIK